MLTAAEKLHILRGVSIFAGLQVQVLQEMTTIVEEISVPAGTTIFEKGDTGTSMFVIVEGRVRVHYDERTVNFLGEHEVFGEMAALDAEARSASVTATDDTVLLRIDQQPLYALMVGRTEVVYGFIRILIERLRQVMNDMTEDFKYLQQFARVTAAASAVEAGVFEPESLDEVAQRTDELGQLARVFQRMTRKVAEREQRLAQEAQALRIEIDHTKQARQVAEITDTDYFRELRRRVKDLKDGASSSER